MNDQGRRVCEIDGVDWRGPDPCWVCGHEGTRRDHGFERNSVAGKGSASGTNYEPDLAEKQRMRGEIVMPADLVEGAA